MWKLEKPKPVKLIVGILSASGTYFDATVEALEAVYGKADLSSKTWIFDKTDYYKGQMGSLILRRFVSFEKLISQGRLADIKLKTNKLERKLTRKLYSDMPRPINLDPGFIGPSKLVLATTKNYAHRIYIGKKIYAEVTLVFYKGKWQPLPYTYPDYTQECYFGFFDEVRECLLEQLISGR